MFKSKIKHIWLRITLYRVMRKHMKYMKEGTELILFCLKRINKICIPVNEKQNEMMKNLLSAYDNTIAELNKSVDIYRERVIYDEPLE